MNFHCRDPFLVALGLHLTAGRDEHLRIRDKSDNAPAVLIPAVFSGTVTFQLTLAETLYFLDPPLGNTCIFETTGDGLRPALAEAEVKTLGAYLVGVTFYNNPIIGCRLQQAT